MILELDGLTKLYKNGRGADGISFALDKGEVLGLLGPNGSGKTTTMRSLVGLTQPTSGSVRICGVDALHCHEQAMKNVGCLVEAPALYTHMTARQNLRLAARFYPESVADTSRIDLMLRMVGLDRYVKDKVSAYSLGMRARLGLALALLSAPQLLILDEPANGLDIEGMVFVREVVKQAAAGGTAVLISSHLASEVEQVATKVAIIYDGRLLCVESMDGVLSKHPNLEAFFLEQVAKMRREAGAGLIAPAS